MIAISRPQQTGSEMDQTRPCQEREHQPTHSLAWKFAQRLSIFLQTYYTIEFFHYARSSPALSPPSTIVWACPQLHTLVKRTPAVSSGRMVVAVRSKRAWSRLKSPHNISVTLDKERRTFTCCLTSHFLDISRFHVHKNVIFIGSRSTMGLSCVSFTPFPVCLLSIEWLALLS